MERREGFPVSLSPTTNPIHHSTLLQLFLRLLKPSKSFNSYMNIQNLSSYDPFADTGDSANNPGQETDSKKSQQTQQEKYIHIRVQQRNGRKTLTTVQGLPKG